MKKLVAILCILCMICGCQENNSETSNNQVSQSENLSTEEKKEVKKEVEELDAITANVSYELQDIQKKNYNLEGGMLIEAGIDEESDLTLYLMGSKEDEMQYVLQGVAVWNQYPDDSNSDYTGYMGIEVENADVLYRRNSTHTYGYESDQTLDNPVQQMGGSVFAFPLISKDREPVKTMILRRYITVKEEHGSANIKLTYEHVTEAWDNGAKAMTNGTAQIQLEW